MKDFSALLLDQQWAETAYKWKQALLTSPEARAKGFDSETGVEEVIAVFIDAVLVEKAQHGLKGFAFDLLHPWLVSFDKKTWHEIEPYGGKLQHANSKN